MRTEITATKAMSNALNSKTWNAQLLGSSRNLNDAKLRKEVYQRVFSNYDKMASNIRTFSGAAEANILSNQYFNATMASYVRSFAGFMSIERDMDQPTALLWYYDLIGVLDGREVLPNVGKDNLAGISAHVNYSLPYVNGSPINYSAGEKVIPGSVLIKVIGSDNSTIYEIRDDNSGNLVAPAGVLSLGTVNYTNGNVDFTFTPAQTNATIIIDMVKDAPGTPNFGAQIPVNGYNNRFKLNQYNIEAKSEPDLLINENNLLTIAASQRAMGVNPNDLAGAKLTELYTKLINYKLTAETIRIDNSTPYDIDASSWTFMTYRSKLDAFVSELVSVDTALANISGKGVMATCYLVGTKMGNWFRRLKSIGNFVDNTESTYINDLLGYCNGVPVLRHDAIDSLSADGKSYGFAIHKTVDGQLAPVMRGIFLPLTNTPVVGNYNNPTQTASGVFYQEANNGIIPELVQKFSINADN